MRLVVTGPARLWLGLWFAVVAGLALVPGIGNVLLGLACVLMVAGAVRTAARAHLWKAALLIIYGCSFALLSALLLDRFGFRYVWLYSSPTLAPYLKAANFWGGDEGTLLLLAAMFAPLAVRQAQRPGWEALAPGLLTAWYLATAVVMGPFSPTPEAWLAAQASQGMNAHLQKVWMALHAPAVLAAYVWAMAPVGSAIQALRGKPNDYVACTLRYNRRAWALMTAGIGFGMVWALGDFTFGQLWHWDPVQTSSFVVWAMLGAVLHGVRHWRPQGGFSRLLPALSLLLAAVTALSMAVTRSATLASSHRYIGTTSWLGHLLLSSVLVATACVLYCQHQPLAHPQRAPARLSWATRLSVWLFCATALAASAALALAYARQWGEAAKPVNEKPFFETLVMWANAAEIQQLRRAFAQWTVEGYSLSQSLLPLIGLMGLVGGYTFLRKAARGVYAAVTTGLVLLVCAALVWHGGLISAWYEGRGVLSSQIVRVLPWLDAALASAAFLLLACLYWSACSVARSRKSGALRVTGSLALIHAGAVIALVGGFAATALNTYQAVQLSPEQLQTWRPLPDGSALRVSLAEPGQNYSGYQAVAQVEVRAQGSTSIGQALFMDGRHQPAGYQGPVRQLCEILDYRYARYAGGPRHLLDPFVIRGWWGDQQVWVPASSALMGQVPADDAQGPTLIVIRRYPLVSLVWLGLVCMVLGALIAPSTRKAAMG